VLETLQKILDMCNVHEVADFNAAIDFMSKYTSLENQGGSGGSPWRQGRTEETGAAENPFQTDFSSQG